MDTQAGYIRGSKVTDSPYTSCTLMIPGHIDTIEGQLWVRCGHSWLVTNGQHLELRNLMKEIS